MSIHHGSCGKGAVNRLKAPELLIMEEKVLFQAALLSKRSSIRLFHYRKRWLRVWGQTLRCQLKTIVSFVTALTSEKSSPKNRVTFFKKYHPPIEDKNLS